MTAPRGETRRSPADRRADLRDGRQGQHGPRRRSAALRLRGPAREVALEAGGRAGDQEARRRIAAIGERVRDAAGDEDELAGSLRDELVLDLEGELTLQH